MGKLYHFYTFRVLEEVSHCLHRGASSLDPLCNNYVGKAICNVRSSISLCFDSVAASTQNLQHLPVLVLLYFFFFLELHHSFQEQSNVLRRIPTVQHKARTDKKHYISNKLLCRVYLWLLFIGCNKLFKGEAVATGLPSRTTTGTRLCARSSDLCLFPDHLFCLSDTQTPPPCV